MADFDFTSVLDPGTPEDVDLETQKGISDFQANRPARAKTVITTRPA